MRITDAIGLVTYRQYWLLHGCYTRSFAWIIECDPVYYGQRWCRLTERYLRLYTTREPIKVSSAPSSQKAKESATREQVCAY